MSIQTESPAQFYEAGLRQGSGIHEPTHIARQQGQAVTMKSEASYEPPTREIQAKLIGSCVRDAMRREFAADHPEGLTYYQSLDWEHHTAGPSTFD